jgi:hypothetical protein
MDQLGAHQEAAYEHLCRFVSTFIVCMDLWCFCPNDVGGEVEKLNAGNVGLKMSHFRRER